jgi:hypothetical protein
VICVAGLVWAGVAAGLEQRGLGEAVGSKAASGLQVDFDAAAEAVATGVVVHRTCGRKRGLVAVAAAAAVAVAVDVAVDVQRLAVVRGVSVCVSDSGNRWALA